MAKSLRVLMVEDSEDDAILLMRELNHAGYDPYFTRVDTPAAMRAALQTEIWDLVIADYVMPHFSAPGALALLKEMDLDLPFIIVSGNIGEETAVTAMRAGAHDYLMKGKLARLGPAIERELAEASVRRERRLAEQALRESEERYRSLVEATSQAVWTARADGEIAADIPGWRKITGQTAQELKGWGWLEQVHGDDRERVRQEWAAAVAAGGFYDTEYRVRTEDGSYRNLVVRAVPVREQDGTIREWVGTTTDITERKRAEEELREANRAKDRFLAVLSHELRNPLAAIGGAADLLQRRTGDDSSVRQLIGLIKRNVELQARLVDDLLDLSRIALGKVQITPAPVRLDLVASATVEQVRAAAEEAGIALHAGPLPVVWVAGDRERLEQVLMNLLSNAVKFTPHGGQIRVLLTVDGETAELAVEDTGVGIDPAESGYLFEIFRQGEGIGRQPGLGVGLAVVKQLVELHGGSVRAHSEGPGKGSRFVVRLKTTVAPPQAGDDAVTRSPDAALRVLLIDDNADALQVLAEILAMEGWEVLAARSGEEALTALVGVPAPDVIVSDLGLPGMDGRTFLRRVREMEGLESIPALALSGYGEEDDDRASREAGFHAHLVKPFDIDELIQRIREASINRDGSTV